MQRALSVGRRLRTAQRLAVHGDHLARLGAQRGRPGGKASLQSLRVQQAKNLAQSLRRRDAAGERQKGAQPVQRPGRDLLYTLPVVRSAHDANQRRQQHLVQGIGDPFPESGGPTQPAYDPETQATWRGPPSFSNPTWLISRYRFRTLPWAMPPVAVKTRYRSSETGVSRGISGSVRHSGSTGRDRSGR